MPKKSTAAKSKAKTGAKRGPGRPPGSKNKKSTAPAKKTAAKKTSAKNVKKPAGKRGGLNRELNEATGFVVGTDQDAIATALLEGGESRADIVERLENELDTETRNGTPKQITNMVSGVLNKLLARGYTVESSFQVLEPTPASKRAATAAANKRAKQNSKPAAKKTAAKRGPGRPKGSKNTKAAKKGRK